MPWPAPSPHLNLIQHLWDEIRERLNEVQPKPTTVAELGSSFLRVWVRIPMAIINHLIH